jgi:hypothetical protein
MKIPTADERPTVTVREAAPWFSISAASFYRCAADGNAPCDVIRARGRVVVVTASARRVLGLDAPATNGERGSEPTGPE